MSSLDFEMERLLKLALDIEMQRLLKLPIDFEMERFLKFTLDRQVYLPTLHCQLMDLSKWKEPW